MKKIILLAGWLLAICGQLHAQAVKTSLHDSAGIYSLYRNGVPYTIKGAATNRFPDRVADFGGNTIRTYSINDSTDTWLDNARDHGITVCLGLGIKKGSEMNYNDTALVNAQFRTMRDQVRAFKDHSAVLMWAIGNEPDANYPDTGSALWKAVNDIAEMIHLEDTNHLTTTVLVNSAINKVKTIKQHAPALDILSINSYAPNVPGIVNNLASAGWIKPYMVTEFGPRGTWQMNPEPKRIMPWGAFVEETSTEKAVVCRNVLQNHIEANRVNNCLGGFVFVWGYLTSADVATWYGLYSRREESFGAADEMQYVWTGSYPSDRAPVISSRNDFRCNGKKAEDTVIMEENSINLARVTASDPDNDPLQYEWLVVPEGFSMLGGDPFASLPTMEGLIIQQAGDSARFRAPSAAGNYRLYVYVHDGRGKIANACIPFKVIPSTVGGLVVSAATGGNWTNGTSWQGGIPPSTADTVHIISGSTITINTSPTVACAKVSGTLAFNSTTTNTFTSGDLTINAGGVFNAYNGTTGRKVTVNGNLINNGTVNFSKTATTLTMGQAADSTQIGGNGTFTTGIVRSLTINNSNSVRLNVNVSIASVLNLSNGTFKNGTHLTMDNTQVGGSASSTFCTVQRSQSASLQSPYTLGGTAALYVVYHNNTSEPAQAITEGFEIPTSRSFHSITVNNPAGVNILDNCTLKSSNAALVLTAGILDLASAKTITCSNTAYAGVAGAANSFVDGAVALTTGTAPGTRTFPIGKAGKHRKVVLTGLSSVSGALTVRMVIDTPGGTPGTGMSSLSAAARWKGTIQSGTLQQFSSISIDTSAGDGGGLNRIAQATTRTGVYNALPAGSITGNMISSGTGAFTSLGWFAIGMDSSGFETLSLRDEDPFEKKVRNTTIQVYPNPFSKVLYLRLPDGLKEKLQLVLYDVQGIPVHQAAMNGNRQQALIIPLPHQLKPGAYLLSITSQRTSQVFKIVAQ